MTIQQLYDIYLHHPVITTDSRHCPAGSLFFALKGDRFDGNRYAATALEQGCAYAVVDDAGIVPAGDERYLRCDDVLATMQQLARHHRRQLATPIIGITGTNGKTTTKELVAAVLARKYRTLYTEGNLNNHIGVPRTLLRLSKEHDMAVVEMGANHPGEIHTLVDIAEPDYGIITNVGLAHIEGFGSLEGVIRTKGELYDFLRNRPGSKIFLHQDNPRLTAIAAGIDAVRYGTDDNSHLDIAGRNDGCNPYLSFSWRTAEGPWHHVDTQLIGDYNIANLLAAVAVGCEFGIPADDICAALEAYKPTNNRSQLLRTADNTLIVDTYNANLTSMTAALDNFHRLTGDHKWVILGDMKELGDASAEAHQQIVDRLGAMAPEQVWLVGSEFAKTRHSFRTFDNVDDVKVALQQQPPKGKLILVKGSNSMRLFELPPML